MSIERPVLNRFPNELPPYIKRAEGIYLYAEDGRKILDATAGYSACVSLGYSHPAVIKAIEEQIHNFSYLCSHAWSFHKADELAEVLLSQAPKGLDQVYYSGSSGSDSLEAAMKLSYQVRYNTGKKEKTWFICRDNSYHGATLQALAVTNVDIWEFYKPLMPTNIAVIPQHDQYRNRLENESVDDYARRSAKQLEEKILEIGPGKVCAFIAETMLGQLAGNIPPAPGYWKYVREICDKYDVHLILDEVYCGLSRSGKVYCCSWDEITPDFVGVSKMLGAGYIPLSAVITKQEFRDVIAKGQGRVMYAHTYQAHPVGIAAALAVQKEVHKPEMLAHVNTIGRRIYDRLNDGLGSHPFFRNVHGRGLLVTLEYDCPNKHGFGSAIEKRIFDEHNIVINSRWHRSSFTPANIITATEADLVVDTYIGLFKEIAATWPTETKR